MVRYPITGRQRELCRVAQSAPEFTEPAEIRELASINLLMQHRDSDAVVVVEPVPGDIWAHLPLLDYDEGDDEW